MSTVTEEECTDRQGILHSRINERPTLKIVLWMLFIFFLLIGGSYGYTSTSTGKIEQRQWEFSEKMVTKDDLTEFKQDIKGDLDSIQRSIENIGR